MSRRTTFRQKLLQRLLRESRLAASLNQADVATRLGRPQSFVSKYESGERRLDLVELQEVCVALDMKLSDLVRLYEESDK